MSPAKCGSLSRFWDVFFNGFTCDGVGGPSWSPSDLCPFPMSSLSIICTGDKFPSSSMYSMLGKEEYKWAQTKSDNQAVIYSTLLFHSLLPHLLSKSPGLMSGELAREIRFNSLIFEFTMQHCCSLRQAEHCCSNVQVADEIHFASRIINCKYSS